MLPLPHSLRRLLLLCVVLKACHCFEWTPELPDKAAVDVCTGAVLSLPWNYTLDDNEAIEDVRWYFQGHGSNRTIVGVFAGGAFLPNKSYQGRCDHHGNAHLECRGVTLEDGGNYTVHVMVCRAGQCTVHDRSAHVEVADAPQSASNVLTVTQSQRAVYDQHSGQYHVMLTCGPLSNTGYPPAHVEWTTPDDTVLSSSEFQNGSFHLLLQNPVKGGNYSCRLPSPFTRCLPQSSPLRGEATVLVDEVTARLTLLEARDAARKTANDQLTQQVQDLQHKLELTTRQVAFHVRLHEGTHLLANQPIVMTEVITNIGNHYNTTTGKFTAPLDGLYLFMAMARSWQAGKAASVILCVNTKIVQVAYTKVSADDFWYMVSLQATVHVEAGQSVWLASHGESYLWAHETTLTGVLLKADV